MSIEDALGELTGGLAGCLASGLVDLPTGTLVGSRALSLRFKEEFEQVAATTTSVFDAAPAAALGGGSKVLAVGAAHGGEFREVTLIGNGRVHVYCRSVRNPDLALVVVCQTSTSLGMILARARLQLAAIESRVS